MEAFVERFNEGWSAMMAAKLGLHDFDPDADTALIHDLLELLPRTETDMTLFFRGLAEVPVDDGDPGDDDAVLAPLLDAYYLPDELSGDLRADTLAWLARYRARVRPDRAAAMHAVNPRYVLRNYLAQLAIDDAERGDPALIGELLDVLRDPYDEQPGRERFAEKRPDWARTRPGCSMLSCSS